jgi:DNA-binding NarL/FixJ family response regulator
MKFIVAILDDHETIIEGVKSQLAKHPCVDKIVGTTKKNDIQKLITDHKASLLCLDLDLKDDGNGLEVLKELKKKLPDLKILIFTHRDQEMVCYSVKQAGADGLVSKGDKSQELYQAISVLAENKPYYSEKVLSFFSRENTNTVIVTATELDILKKLAVGNSQAVIASQMKRTVDTIENNLRSLRNKFKVTTTAELIYEATIQGFI